MSSSEDLKPCPENVFQDSELDDSAMSAYEMETLEPLHYEPLPMSRSFRLLRIPEVFDKYDLLPLELGIYDLDQAPPFSAISYTWGAPIRVLSKDEWCGRDPEADYDDPQSYDGCVICNDQQVRIGENLFDCLEELAEIRAGEYLWIDALCINQEDIAERNTQVRLMSDIYASAERTIVWLGKENLDREGVNIVLDHFLPSYKKWYNDLDERTKLFTNRIQLTDPSLLQQLNLPGSTMDWVRYWRALQKFFWRTKWFHRAWISELSYLHPITLTLIWLGSSDSTPNSSSNWMCSIVQEVSLASSVQVLYGNETLNWDAMIDVVDLIHSSDLSLPEITGNIPDSIKPLRPPLEGARTITSLYYMFIEGSRNPVQFQMELSQIFGSLAENQRWYAMLIMTLQQARTQDCADARDKVYANWSLVKGFAPSGLNDVIAPDYNLPVEHVYTSVAEVLLANLPRLALLSYVLTDIENRALPTWVPDFRVQPLGRLLITHFPHFDAAPQDLHTNELSVNDGKVSILAYHIDTISDITPTLSDMNDTGNMLPCLELCLKVEPLYAQTQESRLDALWRTLICDSSGNEHPAPLEASRQRFRGWLLWQIMHYLATSHVKDEEVDKSELRRVRKVFEEIESKDWPLPRESEISDLVIYHKHGLESSSTGKVEEQYHRMHNIYSDFRKLSSWALNGRRLFNTSNGHIGLALAPVKVGDQVWLLGDAKAPFVLRTIGPEFGLVGDAYIHGFMYGTKLESNVVKSFRPITII